jgi:hypothetical protein
MWFIWLILFVVILNMFVSDPWEKILWVVKFIWNIILFIFFVWALVWSLNLLTGNPNLIGIGVTLGVLGYLLFQGESR